MAFSLLPTVETDSLTDVTPALLAELGVEALFLDFDNTIVPYTTDVPTAEMQDWLRLMQSSGVFLCVVSNSKKPRVVAFCRQQGIPCVTHARKPFSRGIREALGRYRLDPRRTALAGDQIFTDVLGANCCGLTSILVQPIFLHNIWLRLRRGLESPFRWLARGRHR